MRQRIFHRGITIDNPTSEPGCWKAKIYGNDVVGDLDIIRKCIDWSTEMRAFVSPEQIKKQAQNTHIKERPTQQSCVHHGFKIINDSGKENEWYLLIRGQLLKGSLAAVKRVLDQNIDKLR
ncbi:DUF3319 domain-containing protein [Thaumasiovibrio sp. DFM-14]|uniref:DUF3319 domain-containing protein n=1 Tax=Thaumasiovibrio sp. DFM-14 TaxID=3384792 RepID=UPI00399FEC21